MNIEADLLKTDKKISKTKNKLFQVMQQILLRSAYNIWPTQQQNFPPLPKRKIKLDRAYYLLKLLARDAQNP